MADSLGTAAGVKAACNLGAFPDAAITPWLTRARDLVRGYVGATIYAAMLELPVPSPYDAEDVERVTRGENLLAGALAVRHAGIISSGQGLMRQSGGMQGGQTSLSQEEVRRVVAGIEAQGYAQLVPYRQTYLAAIAGTAEEDPRRLRSHGFHFRAGGVTT